MRILALFSLFFAASMCTHSDAQPKPEIQPGERIETVPSTETIGVFLTPMRAARKTGSMGWVMHKPKIGWKEFFDGI